MSSDFLNQYFSEISEERIAFLKAFENGKLSSIPNIYTSSVLTKIVDKWREDPSIIIELSQILSGKSGSHIVYSEQFLLLFLSQYRLSTGPVYYSANKSVSNIESWNIFLIHLFTKANVHLWDTIGTSIIDHIQQGITGSQLKQYLRVLYLFRNKKIHQEVVFKFFNFCLNNEIILTDSSYESLEKLIYFCKYKGHNSTVQLRIYEFMTLHKQNDFSCFFYLAERLPESVLISLLTLEYLKLAHLYYLNNLMFDKLDWESLQSSGCIELFDTSMDSDNSYVINIESDSLFADFIIKPQLPAVLIIKILTNYGISFVFIKNYIVGSMDKLEHSLFEWVISGHSLQKYFDLPFLISSRQVHYFNNIHSLFPQLITVNSTYRKILPEYINIENKSELVEKIRHSIYKFSVLKTLLWINKLFAIYLRHNARTCIKSMPEIHIELYSVPLFMLTHWISCARESNVNILEPYVPDFSNYSTIPENFERDCLLVHDMLNGYFESSVMPDFVENSQWGRQVNLAIDWHRLQLINEAENLGEGHDDFPLPESGIKPFFYQKGDINYLIKQITTSEELKNEGKMLEHCVYSYLGACIDKSSYIFSMAMILNEDDAERLVTIELVRNIHSRIFEIRQAMGFQNRDVTQEESSILEKWKAYINNLGLL